MTLMGAYIALLHLLIGLSILVFAAASESPATAILSVPVVVFAYLLRRSNAGFGAPQWLLNTALVGFTLWTLATASWALDQTVMELARYITFIQLARLFEKPSSRKWAQEIGLSAMLVLGAALTSVVLSVGVLILIYSLLLLVTVLAHQICAGAWRDAARSSLPVMVNKVTPRLRRDFFRVLVTSFSIMGVCSIAAFVLTPRGLGADMFFGANLSKSVGSETKFSDAVTLGEEGLINESSVPVMRVKISEDFGDPPYLLRGTTLNVYDPLTSSWSRKMRSRDGERSANTDDFNDLWPDRDEGTAIAEIEVLKKGAQYFFSLSRVSDIATPNPQRFSLSSEDGTIRLRAGELDRNSEYAILSTLPQTALPSEQGSIHPSVHVPFLETGVLRIANEVLDTNGVGVGENIVLFRERAAEAFLAYLSEGFMYTLDRVSPMAGTDPLAYFLEQSREGHCEYFASALAAMCQSVGVEARMVTGYHVSERESEDSNVFIVRESHAHAWTEVKLANGIWREYDPSPADGVATQHQPAKGLVATYRRFMDNVQIAWSKYVVNFDEKKQSGTIGNSLMSSAGGYDEISSKINQFTNLSRVQGTKAVLRSLGLGLFMFVVTYAALTLARMFVRWTGRKWPRRNAIVLNARRTEIGRVYGALLAALAKAGVGKPAWSSPLLHAQTLAEIDPGIAHGTREIAALYYQTAFGGRDVSGDESARAGDELKRVRARLRELTRERALSK